MLYKKASIRKGLKYISITAFTLLGVQLLSPFDAYASQSITRLAGQDRYETVKKISDHSYGSKVGTIILASGGGFADALSAEVLARNSEAPIILVGNQGVTYNQALDYINEHLEPAGKLYLIGGSSIFDLDFVKLLLNNGFYNIEQIGGNDRYQTNALLLEKSNIPNESPVFITSGDDLPDSMAISSIASNKGWPVLFTKNGEIVDSHKEYLSTSKPSIIYIVGGYSVVPQNIETELNILLPESKIIRLAGKDRYETLAQVLQTFNLAPTNLFLVTDSNLSDEVSASIIASKTGDPLLLVDSSSKTPPKSIANYLAAHKNTDIGVTSIGGSAVVSDQLVSSITKLLDGSVETSTVYSVADINTEITVGDTFKFPQTVKALLYDSTTIEVPVTWATPTLDSSITGVYQFNGSVAGLSESIKLTVTVSKRKESYENLKSKLIEKLGSNADNVGIAFKDLTTGTSFSINGDKKFLAASTAKVPRVMILYDLIREGKLNEDQLSYFNSNEYEGGTGVIQYGNLNQPFSFNTLAEDAIVHSDNIAVIMIGDNMCEQEEEQQRERTLIGHDLNIGGDNILSANDALIILNHLYTGASNGDAGYQKIVGWLRDTDFHDRLDRNLNHSMVAHKIGNLNEATNDIGIFYTDRPYILTVYTSYLTNPNDVITSISDIVYDYQNVYGN